MAQNAPRLLREASHERQERREQPQKPWSRRSFIQTAAMTAAALALPGCSRKEKPVLSTLTGDFDPLRTYPYRGWEDFYRKIWTWDKVVRSTHSANCTGSCSWKVYVRNGVMVREEQAADYPRINARTFPTTTRAAARRAAALRNMSTVRSACVTRSSAPESAAKASGAAPPGTKRSRMVAEKLLDNIYNYGPDTNSFFSVIPAMSPVSFCAGSRLAHYIGGVFLSFYDWYCDLPPGEPLTWGVQTEACECADWFNSKYIVLWGSNISQTRIPDAHFAYEARYNGAKIVCISPDYNASATHADLYFRINPGTRRHSRAGRSQAAHRSQPDRRALCERTNRHASARAFGHEPFPARVGPQERRQGRHLLFLGHEAAARRAHAGLDGIGAEDHPTQRRRSCADGHLSCATRRWQDRRSHHGFRTAEERNRRIHSRQSRRAHRPARPRNRTLRQRTGHAQAGDDHPRRRHQPLVPQRSDQPLLHPAGGPHRQHRQKRRWIQSLCRAGTPLAGAGLFQARLPRNP